MAGNTQERPWHVSFRTSKKMFGIVFSPGFIICLNSFVHWYFSALFWISVLTDIQPVLGKDALVHLYCFLCVGFCFVSVFSSTKLDRPLFTRYRPPSSLGGLVQLGLDESNQIKVYHYWGAALFCYHVWMYKRLWELNIYSVLVVSEFALVWNLIMHSILHFGPVVSNKASILYLL